MTDPQADHDSRNKYATIATVVVAVLALASQGCSGCGGDLAPDQRDDAATVDAPTGDDGGRGDQRDGGQTADSGTVSDAAIDSGGGPGPTPGSLLLSITTALGTDPRGDGYACVPVVSGGAGITATTIAVQTYEHETPGTCVPVTLTRARGGIVTGTYAVNCVSPDPAPCVDQDETMSTSALPAGGYIVRVSGRIGSPSCWSANDVVQVTAGQQTNHLVILEHRANPGCPAAPLAPPPATLPAADPPTRLHGQSPGVRRTTTSSATGTYAARVE